MSAITLGHKEKSVSHDRKPRSPKDRLLLLGAATMAVIAVVVTAVVSVLGGSGYQETHQPLRTRTKFDPKPAVLLPAKNTCDNFASLPPKGRENVVESDPKYQKMQEYCDPLTIRPQKQP